MKILTSRSQRPLGCTVKMIFDYWPNARTWRPIGKVRLPNSVEYEVGCNGTQYRSRTQNRSEAQLRLKTRVVKTITIINGTYGQGIRFAVVELSANIANKVLRRLASVQLKFKQKI